MPTLELTLEEIKLLEETLEYDLSDLRMEIVDTDRVEFKSALKYRKVVLMEILEKLERCKIAPALA